MVKRALDVGGVCFVLFLPVAAPDDDDAGFDLGLGDRRSRAEAGSMTEGMTGRKDGLGGT